MQFVLEGEPMSNLLQEIHMAINHMNFLFYGDLSLVATFLTVGIALSIYAYTQSMSHYLDILRKGEIQVSNTHYSQSLYNKYLTQFRLVKLIKTLSPFYFWGMFMLFLANTTKIPKHCFVEIPNEYIFCANVSVLCAMMPTILIFLYIIYIMSWKPYHSILDMIYMGKYKIRYKWFRIKRDVIARILKELDY